MAIGALEAAIAALRTLPRTATKGALVIEKIDGRSAQESPHAETFRAAGFGNDYRGLMDGEAPDFGQRA